MKKIFLIVLCSFLFVTGCSSGSENTNEETASTNSDTSDSQPESEDSSDTEFPGLTKDVNSPNMAEWSNVVDGYEYYVNDDNDIARRKADGSEDEVIIDGYTCYRVWAIPEGLFFTDRVDLYRSNLDGSDLQVFDDDRDQDPYSSMVIDDTYISYMKGYPSKRVWIDRSTMEQVEIPETLENCNILMITDGKFYYFPQKDYSKIYSSDDISEDQILCSCNLDGSDERELMIMPFAYEDELHITIVDGDTFVGDTFKRVLYKFPAGTGEATEDMQIIPPDSKNIVGYNIRDGVIYCTDDTQGYQQTYYKLDMDGNYLGEWIKEDAQE